MAVTSGTYNFLSTTSQQMIDEAWERAGLLPDVITHQKIITAQRSANLILTEWINKGYNLWTSTISLIGLFTDQGRYFLPKNVSDVIDVNARTFQRPLGGTAFSSAGGNAASVFGGAGPCTQAAPNGYISYDYGAGVQYEITSVGVLSAANLTYTLSYEWSSDNVNWFSSLFSQPTAYNNVDTIWLDMLVPQNAEFFRIRETGGATLNITQIYFVTNTTDTVMARISGQEWMTYPNKFLASKPSVWWLDRQTPQVELVIWPVPLPQYQVLQVRYITMLQDVGAMTNSVNIPARFYDAFCSAMAKRLAMKKDGPLDYERIALLDKQEREAYSYAATEDTEKVPLRLIPSYLTGWSYVS